MKYQSIKHQAEIEFNENEIEFSQEEQRRFCFGKDLIGNRYKVYLDENNLIVDAFQIHYVRDI